MRRPPLMLPAVIVLVLFLVRPGLAPGQAPPEGQESEVGNGGLSPLALVVFDFKVKEGIDADTGKRIADALSSRLAQEQDFRVVPRTGITEGLEQEGLGPPTPGERVSSVEAGHLLGAGLAVFGRACTSNGSNYLIAKIVSTEDLTLSGVIVEGWLGEEQTALAVRAAQRLSDLLHDRSTRSPAYRSPPRRARSVPRMSEWLREWTRNCALPRIAVIMSESHLGRQLPQPICEASATQFLLDVGLDAYACGTPESQRWAKGLMDTQATLGEFPPETEGADLVLVGHGWSSPTPKHGSYGRLAICDSRVTVKLFDRETGLEMGQTMGDGLSLDRSEEEAARKALERAGERAALYVGDQIRTWSAQHPTSTQEQKGKDEAQKESRTE